MSYSDLTGWMFNLERFGIKLGLENVTEFLDRIGNPHRSFRSVHVTGTNGKGSVCAYTAEILRKHGLKVGLYTSPHLVDFRERIRINGKDISERDVVRIGGELRGTMEAMAAEGTEKQLTFFEFTTGLAFKYFQEKDVDFVVAEVGMGGRLDATNVLSPCVEAITRIGLEHTNYLGKTISEIAREKAGIIKEGTPVVTCERNEDALAVIRSTCEKKRCQLKRIGVDFNVSEVRTSLRGTEFDYEGGRKFRDLRTRLLGAYQAENAAAAVAISEELAKSDLFISDEEIRKGIASTKWPGRLEIVTKNPLLIFDGSHNPDGVRTTVQELETLRATPLTYVIACMDDKDARGIVRAIAPTAAMIVATQAKYKRALSVDKLYAIVKEEFRGKSESVPAIDQALERAITQFEGKGVCAIGSLYLVGEAIQWRESRDRPTPSSPAHKV